MAGPVARDPDDDAGDGPVLQGDAAEMLKVVIAIVLAAHGIGHVIGILQVLRIGGTSPAWDGRSWILGDVAGTGVTGLLGLALWSVAMVGFLAAAAVVLGWLPSDWWTPLALVASLASLAGIVLFPSAFPTSSTIGALVVDLAVLVAVLWYRWTPADIGA
ncbi:MAG: hypothetical protein ABWZ82_10700 [Candidatus Limnocylindrales bacterium]